MTYYDRKQRKAAAILPLLALMGMALLFAMLFGAAA